MIFKFFCPTCDKRFTRNLMKGEESTEKATKCDVCKSKMTLINTKKMKFCTKAFMTFVVIVSIVSLFDYLFNHGGYEDFRKAQNAEKFAN